MVDALTAWWQSALDATLYAMRSYAPPLTWSEVLLLIAAALLAGGLIFGRQGKWRR
jgi:hypothetical protein